MIISTLGPSLPTIKSFYIKVLTEIPVIFSLLVIRYTKTYVTCSPRPSALTDDVTRGESPRLRLHIRNRVSDSLLTFQTLCRTKD